LLIIFLNLNHVPSSVGAPHHKYFFPNLNVAEVTVAPAGTLAAILNLIKNFDQKSETPP